MNKDSSGRVFSYPRFSTAISLVGLLLGSVLIVAVLFSGRARGSLLSSVLLVLIGVWGLFYVVRRLGSPRFLEIRGSELTARYWLGGSRSWDLRDLHIRQADLGSFWEASTVVLTSRDGRVAFRVFRDLTGLERFREAVGRDAN